MALTKIDDRGLKTPIDLLDNEKIRLGTGNDLEIFHNGTYSEIKAIQERPEIVNANSEIQALEKKAQEDLNPKSERIIAINDLLLAEIDKEAGITNE